MRPWKLWHALAAAMLALVLGWSAPEAAGPVETSVFAVQGVAVDVTDRDAKTARDRALLEAQVKAWSVLAERLGSPEFAALMSEMTPPEIVRYLKSLSIEQESTAPGRYIGKLTVRFLPEKIKSLYSSYGIRIVAEQAPPIMIVPVWKGPDGLKLWEDNPWRTAWLDLNAGQALVPLIVPLGDLEDTELITAEEALKGDAVKLEALRRRYEARTLLVAIAEPADSNGVHAVMQGASMLGNIVFDKVYRADEGTVEASAALAAGRFHGVMIEKYRSNRARDSELAAAEGGPSRSMPVAVPFSSPSEWNRIRSRILAAPGVIGVDVSSLAGNGAVIRLMFVGDVDTVQTSLTSAGLQLSEIGGTWVIQPL